MTEIKILATGADFLKENIRGTSPMIEKIIDEANHEIHIMAYVISKNAKTFMDLLEKSLKSGVKMTLVINKLEEQDNETKRRLFNWKKEFSYFKLVDFNRMEKTLHAKVVVVDRDKAVIGSANFSWGGLSGNYEIGVLVQGKDAYILSKLVDVVAFSSEN